ncbi:MAG: efflux RND transporter periplasmic adaptor subunit [Gammaproteobacteria bacterium]|nr:efflux RND transporter periplasmic adaptor subunit [Gammaproteobacteria bacterium]
MTIEVKVPMGVRLALAVFVVLSGPACAQTDWSSPVIVTRDSGRQFSTDGVVKAIRAARLSSQVVGRVTLLAVAASDAVDADHLLIKLDAASVESNLQAARQRLQAAAALLQVTEEDYQQYRRLLDKQFVSRSDFSRIEGRYKSALAEKRARAADVKALETQLNLYNLTAPFAGLVSSVDIVEGDMAMPGVSLLTLYDPTRLYVRIEIPESHASLFSTGSYSNISIDLNGTATSRPSSVRVLPDVDPRSRTVPVELDLGFSGLEADITPGMYARVRYHSAAGFGAEVGQVHGVTRIWVSASAVIRRADLTAVYVLDDSGQPRLRYVRLGRQRDDLVEVLSGVRVGERVLNDPDTAFIRPQTSAAELQ